MKEYVITRIVRTDGMYCHRDCDGLVYGEETECHFFGGCLYAEYIPERVGKYPRNKTCMERYYE